MESRVAVLEEAVSVIHTSIELLRKLAEEHTSELADIRQYVVQTKEIKQPMAFSKSSLTQSLDGDKESQNVVKTEEIKQQMEVPKSSQTLSLDGDEESQYVVKTEEIKQQMEVSKSSQTLSLDGDQESTEEIKQQMEVSKSSQTLSLDGDQESVDDKKEKGEAGSISSEPKGEDVSNELEERKDECLSQLKEENDMLKNKLKELADQHALSEEQYAEKLKQKSFELELADSKIKQHEEKLVQEQSQIKIYAEQVSQLLETEKILRLQLTTEGEKIQHFQDVSNELEERKDECLSLQKENDMLQNKLKELADQYALSEEQYALSEQYYADKLTLKQNSIELELADLKIKQLEEKLVQEQSQIQIYAEQVSQLLETEKILRLQLTTEGKTQQFQDVSNELQERKDEFLCLLKENDILRNKLKELGDQYALSEEQYVEKLKQMSLELELAYSKIKQQEEILVEEQSQIKKYSDQVSQLLETEKILRLQLTTDGKTQQFQLKQMSLELELAYSKIKQQEEILVEEQSQIKKYSDQVSQLLETEKILRLQLTTDGKTQQFQDVSNELQERKDECLSPLKENDMLTNKLKELGDQYALSEEQYVEKLKQMSLELELAYSKIKQQEEKLVEEQTEIKKYSDQVSELSAKERILQLQLTIDREKIKEFQDALSQSGQIFGVFRQESESSTKSIKELKKENEFLRNKSIKELKKENEFLRNKSEKTDATFLELLNERQGLKKQLEKNEKQKAVLESLCRSLQAQRKQSSSEDKGDSSDQT